MNVKGGIKGAKFNFKPIKDFVTLFWLFVLGFFFFLVWLSIEQTEVDI